MNEKQFAACLSHLHPSVIAVLADLYGIGRPSLSRHQVRVKYRLTSARLDYVTAKAMRQVELKKPLQ